MRMYYIANFRMPTEKAHGIQVAKMCEAFIEAGIDLTLVTTSRATDLRSLKAYYGLRTEVPLARLPSFDWYTAGRIGYFFSSLTFMLSYLIFLWHKKISGEKFILYTIDADAYSSSALALVRAPLFSEMHGSKPRSFSQRILFSRARGIIATNKITAGELRKNFPQSRAQYVVEPNGVDLSAFPQISTQDARSQLGLPSDVRIALYAGRFFEWKGLEILSPAAAAAPGIRWQIVGGEREDFTRFVQEPLPQNLFFAGSRPHSEMHLWFAAADALIVLGTARDTQSYRYTSPMKLFEYLATGRPIVASNTPALREIVSEKEVYFYEPDDAHQLARMVQSAVGDGTQSVLRAGAAHRLAEGFSWRARAERVKQFVEKNSHDTE